MFQTAQRKPSADATVAPLTPPAAPALNAADGRNEIEAHGAESTPVPGAADLGWTPAGIPVSIRFDDPYFSVQGGLDEAAHVFLAGNGLPGRFRDGLMIAELGFGTGLNLLATLRAHRQSGASGRFSYVSFERYPLTAGDMARAHQAFPDVAEDAALLRAALPEGAALPDGAALRDGPDLQDGAALPDGADLQGGAALRDGPDLPEGPDLQDGADLMALSGVRSTVQLPPQSCVRFRAGAADVTLILGDARFGVPAWNGRADAWYLDGFSPARNPAMWGPDLLAAVAARTAPGGTFATYSAAGHVRRALAAAGFAVTRGPGFGTKRHMSSGMLRADVAAADPSSAEVAAAGVPVTSQAPHG